MVIICDCVTGVVCDGVSLGSDFLESCHRCELCQATQWRLQEVTAAAGKDLLQPTVLLWD